MRNGARTPRRGGAGRGGALAAQTSGRAVSEMKHSGERHGAAMCRCFVSVSGGACALQVQVGSGRAGLG